MKLIKAAAASLNQTPMAWEANKANILQAISAARREGVSLLCLPELCISGYGCEDGFHSAGVAATSLDVLHEILPDTKGMIVSIGLPVLHESGLFNTACLAADGQILGFVGKQNLAGTGIHYEPRWFQPWPAGVRAELQINNARHPIGDLIFNCGGVRIGFEICEDAWVAQRPGAALAQRGVDIILNPSASHFAFDKQEIRRRFVLEGSRAFNVGYVYANLLGNEAGRAIYDGGTMLADCGLMRAAGRRFSYHDMQLATAVFDLDAIRMTRARNQPKASPANDAGCVGSVFSYPEVNPAPAADASQAWERGPFVKEEEFTRAVSLALFDYLRKSRSAGFVVSLSGGADSAAVALLCALVVRFGWRELGRERLLEKLAYLAPWPEKTKTEIVRRLLTCVYQSTRNSSDATRQAAAGVAASIGACFLEFDVDSVVQKYVGMVSAAVARPLTWEHDDIALQNIQARARAPSVWLLANLSGALLLATSNRSEAAVGYATMDGDTSGGLAPIAGIDKAFLRHWLRWMETEGPQDVGPISALRAVNEQQPTAELRPLELHQTDEADLMPYEVLDAIERAAIRDKHSPLEVFRLLEAAEKEYRRADLLTWVERFFQLWCRNQWKRERYAPSFHLDDENLDPKTWCRFPILSGGFTRELAELRTYAHAKGVEF